MGVENDEEVGRILDEHGDMISREMAKSIAESRQTKVTKKAVAEIMKGEIAEGEIVDAENRLPAYRAEVPAVITPLSVVSQDKISAFIHLPYALHYADSLLWMHKHYNVAFSEARSPHRHEHVIAASHRWQHALICNPENLEWELHAFGYTMVRSVG